MRVVSDLVQSWIEEKEKNRRRIKEESVRGRLSGWSGKKKKERKIREEIKRKRIKEEEVEKREDK